MIKLLYREKTVVFVACDYVKAYLGLAENKFTSKNVDHKKVYSCLDKGSTIKALAGFIEKIP